MTPESKSTSSTKKKKSNNFDIYLASSSPRRTEILKNLKVNFEILKCDFDESNFTDESPEHFVIKNTQQKCLAAHAIRQKKTLPNKPILTADTIVAMDDKIFGKPQNKDHAIAMLLEFSGRKHSVMTCVCLGETDLQSDADVKMTFDLVRTEIQFANLSANQCAKYWETNEPKDKAGAYGIQGYGALFVESLEGSYSNVVGLPIVETCKIFKEKNIGYWLNQ
jgi:septum formation protein